MAGADEFIVNLPQGYDTMLEEGAKNLSGGQRQRLAIARALLTRPEILILDEATSSLDPESERIVRENLAQMAKNRTVIIVSHRLSMLKDADSIIVLANGELVGHGPHAELLAELRTVSQSLAAADGVEMNSSKKKLSEDVLEYQPDAVEIEERPVPGKIRWVLYLILGSLIAAVVGAIIFKVDRIVVAQGELITTSPDHRRPTAQHRGGPLHQCAGRRYRRKGSDPGDAGSDLCQCRLEPADQAEPDPRCADPADQGGTER